MGNSDYKISTRPGYVVVERPPDYEVVLKEQPAALMAMAAACKEADCRKVLILGPKTKVDLAIVDIYELGQEIAEMHLKIAVVESHNASDADSRFLETVTSNRCAPLRFFDTEEEAKEWLKIS